MKPAELAQARGDLVAFAAEMLDSLPRCDQRRHRDGLAAVAKGDED